MTAAGPRLVFDEKERVGEWVAAHMGHTAHWGGFYAMGAELDGEMVAGIVFTDVNDFNANVHVAITRRAKVVLELFRHGGVYAFQQLGLKRLTSYIEETNTRSLALNRRLGFEDEAVLKSAGSAGQDVVIRVCWAQNYKLRQTDG